MIAVSPRKYLHRLIGGLFGLGLIASTSLALAGSIKIAYMTVGTGRPVLLLPAFSTVSSREEMRPLAEHLGARGCNCTLVDWPVLATACGGGLAMGRRFIIIFLSVSRLRSFRRERRS